MHIAKAGTVTITATDGKATLTQTLIINKAVLTVTADSFSRNYGDDNPALTLTYTGFVNGDTPGSLSAVPVATVTASRLSPAGIYPITPAAGSQSVQYSFNFVNGTLTINKINQSLTFNALINRTYGDAIFGLTAASASGLPVAYGSSDPAIASIINDNQVKILKAGTVTITASQPGNGGYNAAADVKQTFTIGKALLTIAADNKTRAYNAANPDFTATYTGFVYGDTPGSLNPAPAFTTPAVLTSNIGTYPISVNGAGSPNYTISYTSGILTVNPAPRNLVFNTIPAKIYGDPDFDPGATVNTGETINYSSSNTTIATITSGKAHIVNAGEAIISAAVPVSNNYSGNNVLTQRLTVNKAPQSITFNSIPLLQRRGADYTLQVSSSSGLPVTLILSDKLVATLNGINLQPLRIGTATIAALQNGNSNYLPAQTVIRDFRVTDDAGSQVKVSQAVSADGDGINDFLIIEGISSFPDNQLVVVNRNGSKVFEISNYDNSSHAFNGKNRRGENLPPGTYYYVLTFKINGEQQRQTGYFILRF